MIVKLRYPKGQLDRKIGACGLSFTDFAIKAGIDRETLRRARLGLDLTPRSFGRIHMALAHAQAVNGEKA